MTDVFISYAKADNRQGEMSALVETLMSTPSPAGDGAWVQARVDFIGTEPSRAQSAINEETPAN